LSPVFVTNLLDGAKATGLMPESRAFASGEAVARLVTAYDFQSEESRVFA
jgi:hypothetical protein